MKIRQAKNSDFNEYLKLKREEEKDYSKFIGKKIPHPASCLSMVRKSATPLKMLEANIHSGQASSAERVLILVDQFEEVFTLCRDEVERIAFIEKLLSYAQ